jgi:hypothetical protein
MESQREHQGVDLYGAIIVEGFLDLKNSSLKN